MSTDHAPIAGHNTGQLSPGINRTMRRPPDIRFATIDPGLPGTEVVGTHPFLPIDTPPSKRATTHLPPVVERGLDTRAKLNAVSPVRRPWAPYNSDDTFPLAMQSQAGPAAIGARLGVARNTYSPSTHWMARQLREAWAAVPVISNKFYGTAKGSQRIKGRVVPQPFASPAWTSITGRTIS